MAGAGPLKTFRSITLRLGLPGVLALMLLIGIRAFESFEVPALVGLAGNVTVLTTNIYQSSKNIGAINFGESGAYSVCLLFIVVLLLLWHNRLAHYAHQFQTITGKGYRPRILDLGRWRYLTAALLGGYLFVGFYLSVVPPIRRIVAALHGVADGDLGHRVVVGTQDELSFVARRLRASSLRTSRRCRSPSTRSSM